MSDPWCLLSVNMEVPDRGVGGEGVRTPPKVFQPM